MPHTDVAWVDPTEGESFLGPPSLDDLRFGTIDLVLAVPKSVSVYYASLRAAGRHPDAERVVETHEAAVHTALRYLNREAAWAKIEDPFRPGAAEYSPAKLGLRVIQLEHIESAPAKGERFGEPHVHTHLFVDPELTAASDNRPHPLDSAAFRREVPMARSLYERDLAEQMMIDFAVRFARRPSSRTAEIVGIDDESMAVFPMTHCRPFSTVAQLLPPASRLVA